MTDIVVIPYSEYQITADDRLLFSAPLNIQDANGLTPASARAALDFFKFGMVGGTFKLRVSSVLRFAGMEGDMYAYVLPELKPLPPKMPAALPLAPFNNGQPANGATWYGADQGDGVHTGRDWPKGEDMTGMLALGVKTVRMPIKMRYCVNADGTIQTWVLNTLASMHKILSAAGASLVLDAHEYELFNNPAVRAFWAKFAPAQEKANGGPSPFFGIELMNEPGKGSKDLTVWAEPLRATIKEIRLGGYQGYIFAGAGDWNNITFLPTALAEVERTGGVKAMDPFDRTIYTGHDYWNKDSDPGKTRNDQGAAVDGTIDIAKRYDPALAAARRIGAKIVISEIGGGIDHVAGSMPPYNGIGKDGLTLQREFFAWARANKDVLLGTWFWMGGDCGLNYRHKIVEGNLNTEELKKFW